MRAVVQRVLKCSVEVGDSRVADIGEGLLVYVGVGNEDSDRDTAYLADKILNLRVFADENGNMNKSVIDIKGQVCLVSQFTLYGDARKGRRPSFEAAAAPEIAESKYDDFCALLRKSGLIIATGVFRAHMQVAYVNDGPVTILLDSKKQF